jgi:hypothetical protein
MLLLLFFPLVIFGSELQSCSLDFEDEHIIQVGEAIPLSDASVDAVVGTLVLCSVKDVDMTLKGIEPSSS